MLLTQTDKLFNFHQKLLGWLAGIARRNYVFITSGGSPTQRNAERKPVLSTIDYKGLQYDWQAFDSPRMCSRHLILIFSFDYTV